MTHHDMLPIAALCLAVLATGCGGSDSPTEPTPQPTPAARTTLSISGAYIEVVDDCDGIEGDGDFVFWVEYSPNGVSDVVFDQTINLPPGGKSRSITRWSHAFDPAGDPFMYVTFRATELDKSITGTEYADARLDGAIGSHRYRYVDGAWTSTGPRAITLGVPGCLVRLHWSAETS